MEKITELVVALILTLNGNVIEHVYKDKMSDCLKSKRVAQREVNPERNIYGSKENIKDNRIIYEYL